MILAIYTTTGHTYQFENVENVCLMNTELHFSYVGVRSGTKTTAVFHNVCGYTTRTIKGCK